MTRRRSRVRAGLLAVLTVLASAVVPLPAVARASTQAAGATEAAVQAVVDRFVADAAAADIRQGIAVLDRDSGAVLAAANSDVVFNSESILKLFTAAYYLVQAAGQPTAAAARTLSTMIRLSDDGIQSELWQMRHRAEHGGAVRPDRHHQCGQRQRP